MKHHFGHRKGKRGWGAKGKVLVFGMLQRNGIVRVCAIPYRETPTLLKKFFPLYLGEISFLFNHREKDLFPLIRKLLQG